MAMRDDDLVAEKLEKMLLESLRSFGEAGDSGWLWNGTFGDGRSVPPKWLGDVGLVGLMGALALLSLDLPRMAASDNVPDLGILRSCFRGGLWGWRPVSTRCLAFLLRFPAVPRRVCRDPGCSGRA